MLSILLLLSWLAALAGCGESESRAPGSATTASVGQVKKLPHPYKIVTTVAMVTDIVHQVAGDKASVQGLIKEGVDPHLYKATRNDVVALDEADVVFYSGLFLEGKMGDVLVKVGRNKPVFAVTELLEEQYLLEPPEFAGHHDPHVWMDVAAWMKGVEAVARSLGEVDPANADYYEANAAAYNEQLKQLDEYAKRAIATIPKEKRVLITAHDAFNYFGRAYGIEVLGIQGLSTESEAGVQQINKLVDLIVERDVPAVFHESSVSAKNIDALKQGALSRGKTVKDGGELFSDAMGPAGTYEGTYIGMIDHNVTLITRALGGEAPERGFQGKLKGGG
jgi:manganese/zinc/iron transport system substrate-binding protein